MCIRDRTGEHAQYIRPPYGCWKCNLDYETKMIEVLWDVDPLDWKTDNSSVIAKRVMDKVQENDIILPVSYTHLDVYKRQGWKCIPHPDESGCGRYRYYEAVFSYPSGKRAAGSHAGNGDAGGV